MTTFAVSQDGRLEVLGTIATVPGSRAGAI
jgi:hypothetical protein